LALIAERLGVSRERVRQLLRDWCGVLNRFQPFFNPKAHQLPEWAEQAN
jgi:hypothetical protein